MADSSATPGNQTSEYFLTKLMAILGTGVAVVGTVIAALTPLFNSLHEQFPAAGWISAIAGALMAIGPVIAYITGRTTLKTAQVESGAAAAVAASQAGLSTVKTTVATTSPAPNP